MNSMIDAIVSGQWLAENRADVRVCDVRSSMQGTDAETAYLEGHVPGAVLVDLERALSAKPGPVVGRHPLPEPVDFARSMGALGIEDTATVVAYDTMGGAFAARLVWMLRTIGQSAALLDGGLAGWPGDLERGAPTLEPVARRSRAWPPTALADADEVAAHVAAGGVVIDSRAEPRYQGLVEPIDPIAGHVPGAVNVPFGDNLDDSGRFLPADRLRARFAAVGADTDTRSIVYCGSGVTACHNALAMTIGGLAPPRVYVGSWSGWSSNAARPIATGEE